MAIFWLTCNLLTIAVVYYGMLSPSSSSMLRLGGRGGLGRRTEREGVGGAELRMGGRRASFGQLLPLVFYNLQSLFMAEDKVLVS